MDTYENQFPESENTLQQPAAEQQEDTSTQEQPTESAAQEKKASPFADSPYVVSETYDAPKQPTKKKKGSKKAWKAVLCAVLAIVVVAGACITTAVVVDDLWEDRMERMSEQFDEQLEALSKQVGTGGVTIIPGSTADGGDILTPSQVYALNVQSVVMIYNKVTTSMYGQSTAATSTGSGFIISADGYVVTNFHVVEGNGEITVETDKGEQYKATIVGYDDLNDVALLKVEAEDLTPVTLGNSDELIVGDQVVAIGNPLGELTSTLTVGYVSAKERDVNTSGFAVNMLQTDAAINSGNSGGPLFNMKGEVIGITTAKYSGTTSSGASIEGVGFAIPIDNVKDLLNNLTTNGYSTSAYLGISVSDLNAEAADYMGIATGGAYVEEVVDGFCAKKAGVQAKDIIVKLGDYDVSNVSELTRVLCKFEAGETTTITVYRSGQKIELEITLDERPADLQQPTQEQNFPSETPEGDFDDWYEYFAPFFGQ